MHLYHPRLGGVISRETLDNKGKEPKISQTWLLFVVSLWSTILDPLSTAVLAAVNIIPTGTTKLFLR